ncbi:MAG: hypothetical protein ACHQ9S_27515 [Candidatus Binatia bacterium]
MTRPRYRVYMCGRITLRQAATASGLRPVLVLALCRSGKVLARVVEGRWWVQVGEFAPWTAPIRDAR